MSTQEKIAAVIAAVNEHAAIYAAVKAPATAEPYDDAIIEGLRKGLVEKVARIFSDSPPHS
jgi:hypothetical protein